MSILSVVSSSQAAEDTPPLCAGALPSLFRNLSGTNRGTAWHEPWLSRQTFHSDLCPGQVGRRVPWWDTAHTYTSQGDSQRRLPAQIDALEEEERDRDPPGHRSAPASQAPGTARQQGWTQAQPLLPHILNSCHQVEGFKKGHCHLATRSNPASIFGRQQHRTPLQTGSAWN